MAPRLLTTKDAFYVTWLCVHGLLPHKVFSVLKVWSVWTHDRGLLSLCWLLGAELVGHGALVTV